MRNTKIVMLGAGSCNFGMQVLRDAFQFDELRGSEIHLVDIDEERLHIMHKLAERFNEVSGAGLKIFSTPDRCRALPEADFVIISIAIRRNELWKMDWQIPLKYGVKHILGENGGPGGLSHTLRNIPIIMDIVRDMEKHCPSAFLLNFTNPESRIIMAVSRYSAIKCVGLCHGIFDGIKNISFITGTAEEEIEIIAGGINHLSWVFKIHHKKTKEDLYPKLKEKCQIIKTNFMPFTRYIYDKFGIYPLPDDKHIGEYFSYAWEKVGLSGYDFELADFWWRGLMDTVKKIANYEEDAGDLVKIRGGEIAFDIICDILQDRNCFRESVNIVNNGCIENLPDNSVVEVPAYVDKKGINGMKLGKLPLPAAAICQQQIAIQELSVDAAILGDKKLALQALLLDPVITSLDTAEKILDEFLSVHKEYLPQFK